MIVSTLIDDANERDANERDVSERDVNERDVSERDVNERDVSERNANERNANERDVNERNVNEWDNTEELNEKDDELSEEKEINWLNDDKELKEEKTSREENAIERVAERLKRRDAKKERNARKEEVRFMKRENVNVLENELEDELKREEDRMKALIFKRLIMRIKLQIQCECLSNYDQWNIDISDAKQRQRVSTTTSFQFEIFQIFQISRHIHLVFCIWISDWWESLLSMRLVEMFRELVLDRAGPY